MNHVVVLLGGSCEMYGEDREHPCVVGVAGPYGPGADRDAIRAGFGELRRSQDLIPHWAGIRDPGDWGLPPLAAQPDQARPQAIEIRYDDGSAETQFISRDISLRIELDPRRRPVSITVIPGSAS